MREAEPRRIRDLVYATFVAEGRAPSIGELARRAGLDAAVVVDHLRSLADAHALVLSEDGDSVRMAHPFTSAPMAFVVTPLDGRDDRRWWGGCAWDSFGISAALGLDVRVDSACPWCGTAVTFPTGRTLAPPAGIAIRFPRPAAQWWDDVVQTCTNIRAFCSSEHAASFSEREAAGADYVADAVTVWQLAHGWYGDRIDADFQPHERAHNQGLLEEVGLVGPFWKLP